MDTNSGYKDRALSSLSGNWAKAVVALLIFLVIIYSADIVLTMTLGADSAATMSLSYLWMFLCVPLTWGIYIFYLDIARGNELSYSKLFDGYKDFLRIFTAYLLTYLCMFIGILLLFVPGIIVALMLSQTSFILKDQPELSAIEAIKQSADMMKGHKMDFFLLWLSFIGWMLLSLLSVGLGFLLLMPYMQTTFAHFYEDLKEEYALSA
jgi:uncharacterized membrane protein